MEPRVKRSHDYIFNYRGPVDILLRLVAAFVLLLMMFSLIFENLSLFPLIDLLVAATMLLAGIFHEGGHFLMMFLGSNHFIMVFGGTFFELFVPLMLISSAIRQRKLIAIWLFTFWLGEQLLHVSRYMASAKATLGGIMKPEDTFLPIMGLAGHITHDWHYMLSQVGLLEYDVILSYMPFIWGCLLMMGAIVGLVAAPERYLNRI